MRGETKAKKFWRKIGGYCRNKIESLVGTINMLDIKIYIYSKN